MSSIAAFKQELAALLRKHGAAIGIGADECSDWNGITGERIVATIGREKVTLADGSWLVASDLDDEGDKA